MDVMKFLRKIFSQQSASNATVDTDEPPLHRERNVELDGDWLTLDNPSFFGRAYISSGKRWIVACDDSDREGCGGFREKGNGCVVLVDHTTDEVIHELTVFARPVEAAVSDIGNYIIHDSGFGSALQGDIIAINVGGQETFRRHYDANIFNISLSRSGRFAAVQTAGSPGNDGNRFEVLDLHHECSVFSVRPVAGWADSYNFDTDSSGELTRVHVKIKNLGFFRYSPSGEFLDQDALQNAQLDKGDYATKLTAVRELLKADASPDNARRALGVADIALAEGAKERYDWGAIAHRVRGESFELLGQLPEALEAFENAVSMNPKVGVQRRITTLRKKLSMNI